jgi:AmpE protein
MEFLIILTAWALLQWQGPAAALHRDHWLLPWHLRAHESLALLPLPARLALLCVLPCVAVAALTLLLGSWLGGLPLFAFGLLILLYCLGRGDIHAELDSYLERWLRGDLEAAYHEAAQVAGIDAAAPIEDGVSLHAQMRRAMLYTALERWFAVVFWFYVLGPAGALFYRIVQFYAQGGRGSVEEQRLLHLWLEWLDWLPARLLGLAFAITGNFVSCFRVWRENLAAFIPVRDLLVIYEEHALDAVAARPDSPQFIERAAGELRELTELLNRSAVSWLVLFALLQMVR